jgi:hypothetical protein
MGPTISCLLEVFVKFFAVEFDIKIVRIFDNGRLACSGASSND